MKMMPSLAQTQEELVQMAAKHFKVEAAEISLDDDIFRKFKINSLQVLELLTQLENHFNVELPDYELQGVSDFRTLSERIHARRV